MSVLVFRLIDAYAVNVLFWDQWDSYRPMFEARSPWQVFNYQHGTTRFGLGHLWSKVIADVTAWNGRAESFGVGVLLIATLCTALYLKVRLFGALTWADAIMPFILLTLLQYESLVIMPMPASHEMPILLVTLNALCWTCSVPWMRYASITLVNFLAVYTGYGLFVGGITPALLICDRFDRVRRRAGGVWWPSIALFASVLVLLAYFVGYRVDAAAGDARSVMQRPGDIIWFVALMLSRALGISYELSALVSTWAGYATLAVLTAALLLHAARVVGSGPVACPISTAIVMLIGFSLLFAGVASLGRMSGGIAIASQSSRYVTLMTTAFLGLYFHLLTVRSLLVRAVSIAVLATLMFPWPLTPADQRVVAGFAAAKTAWKDCYLAIENARECDRRTQFPIYPATDEIVGRLQHLKAHRLNLFADSKR